MLSSFRFRELISTTVKEGMAKIVAMAVRQGKADLFSIFVGLA